MTGSTPPAPQPRPPRRSPSRCSSSPRPRTAADTSTDRNAARPEPGTEPSIGPRTGPRAAPRTAVRRAVQRAARSDPRTAPAFALLGSLQVTLIFTLSAIAVPLPRIGAEFTLTRGDLVLLNASYGLSFAGLLLLGGRLADRHGGRRMLTVGLLLLLATSAGAALTPGFAVLTAMRFAQGVAAALVAPAALAVLRALLTGPAAFGGAMATWGGLSVLGATGGTVLSGAVSSVISWRWIFVLPAAVAVAALLLAPRLLPTTPAPDTGRPPPDLPGAALATAGIVSLTWGLVHTDGHGWASRAVLVPSSAGLVLLCAFALAARRTRSPLLPLSFLRNVPRGLGLAATAVTAAGTSLAFLLLALGLQQQRGWSPAQTSAAFLPYAGALLVTARTAGPLTARFGPMATTAGGLLTGAGGLAVLAAVGPHASYPTGLLPGLVLLPVGAGLSFAGAAVLSVRGVPLRQIGLAGGVLNTAMELGPTIGLAALLTFGGLAAPLAAAAGCFALTALLAALTVLPRNRPSTGERTRPVTGGPGVARGLRRPPGRQARSSPEAPVSPARCPGGPAH